VLPDPHGAGELYVNLVVDTVRKRVETDIALRAYKLGWRAVKILFNKAEDTVHEKHTDTRSTRFEMLSQVHNARYGQERA
jgi:hypothetical protein